MNKGLINWLKEASPDILCIQETKAQPEQIDSKAFYKLGYETYWYSAKRKGYSGTGIVTRIKPDRIIKGMGMEAYDDEGRVLRADFGGLTLISTYFPSGTSGDVRQAFKMQYLEDFTNYITELRKERPKLIITGDLNICRQPIDINFPEKHETMSGFLPEEREWFARFIELGFTDTFRVFCDQPERYSWWSMRTRARSRNLGWRIDYFLTTDNLKPNLVNANILESIVYSDHCPITLDIKS
jgi:exodeoxyribonuclease-3